MASSSRRSQLPALEDLPQILKRAFLDLSGDLPPSTLNFVKGELLVRQPKIQIEADLGQRLDVSLDMVGPPLRAFRAVFLEIQLREWAPKVDEPDVPFNMLRRRL